MFEFRVSKYDPAYRDPDGVFRRPEWTSYADIGRAFLGLVLTEQEYRRVEDAHVRVSLACMAEAGVTDLVVIGLENPANAPLDFEEGSALNLTDLAPTIRRLLREEFWCRLERDGNFLHFGWDYYLYLGVQWPCPQALVLARQLGLFVEPMRSPYRD